MQPLAIQFHRHNLRPNRSVRRGRSRRGFTLLETALATIIIGVGVVSIMELLGRGTNSNVESAELTTGVNLVRNIRELALKFSYNDPATPGTWGLDGAESPTDATTWNDVNDMDGRNMRPPIDSRGIRLDGLANWTQSIVVHSVDPNSLTTDTGNGTSPASRITVTVTHGSQVVTQSTWYVFDGSP